MTAFRDYLACPYRFYLQYIVRLTSVRDDRMEMDAALFGSLLHEALGVFGRGPASSASDPGTVSDALDDALKHAVSKRLGDKLAPALALQVEQARRRLAAFAPWQANRAKEGWLILKDGCEVSAEGFLNVDGIEFSVYGRIDRIERNAETGAFAVLDYKSGESVSSPEQAHRRAVDGVTVWTDLQLPLYSVIAPVPDDSSVTLGYINIGSDPSTNVLMEANWGPDDIADALRYAETTIRNIRNGVFWPPNPNARPSGDGIGAICFEDCADRLALQTRMHDFEGAK